jgi:hypothetical protein
MLLEFLENGKSLGELRNAHQLLAHRDHICPSERHDWWGWSGPRRAVWWGLRLWWVRRGISAKLMSVRVWQGIWTILVIAPVWKPRADFGVRLPCQRHVRTKRVQNRDGWLITSSLTPFPSARPILQACRNTTSVWSSKVIPEPAFTRASRERHRPEVLPVELRQVERVQHHIRGYMPALELIEHGDAVGASDHRLAVHGERFGAQLWPRPQRWWDNGRSSCSRGA